MPTLTINNRSVTVEEGITIIQAADRLGIEIPRYCYHPGLSVAGSCRMCLVEIEKLPKLQPACNTRVSEGMVVFTNTEKVRQAVSGVLEFLLLNHPLDCPVCDQAGECFLQEYYMKFGLYDSRYNENKTKRQKALPIGPHVLLDNERCILCSRCVRFVREITHSHELAIFNRGAESEIRLLPGKALDNPYSGNVVDICPVGALTDQDFRFQCRVWYLSQTASVCPGCSRGCNISIHTNRQRPHHAQGRRVVRLKPRFNSEVNQWWICDAGRYGFSFIDDPSRITQPRISAGEPPQEVSWEDAISRLAREIQSTLDFAGKDNISILASPAMTNEDLFLVWRLFREDLGLGQVGFHVPDRRPATEDGFLIRADKHPNTRGAQTMLPEAVDLFIENERTGKGSGILYLFDHDLVGKNGEAKTKAFLSRYRLVVYQGSNENRTSAMAHILLPAATYAETEGTFTNFEGRVQKIEETILPLGDSLPHWKILIRLARQLRFEYPYLKAEEVFADLASNHPAFAGLTYDSIGERGALLQKK